MTAIDSTGIQALEDFAERLRESGRDLVLCGARSQPARYMQRTAFERHLGAGNLCEHVQGAIERARVILSHRPHDPGGDASGRGAFTHAG